MCFSIAEIRNHQFCRETENENKYFKETIKIDILIIIEKANLLRVPLSDICRYGESLKITLTVPFKL